MKRLQQQQKALGSDVILTLVLDDSVDDGSLFARLWQQIADFEQQFSRFRADSELSLFNQQAGTKVHLSESFLALLRTCQQMSLATNGLFNPLVLPALQQAGYVGSWPKPSQANPELNYSDRQQQPSTSLEIGSGWARILPDSAIEFGGIGKGYLLDQLGETLAVQSVGNYWLSLGGDILCNGYDLDGAAWTVGVQSASPGQAPAGTITNIGRAKLGIATSGITKRQGHHEGKAWHHIIDPRTGKPAATDVLTATIVTATAASADILAKCVVIAGSKEASAILKTNPVRQAFIQTVKGPVINYKP